MTTLEADEHLREELVRREDVYQGRLLSLHRDDVRFADGATSVREVVQHPGAVTVVAIDGAGRVVLVRQWRHATGRALWELPAGTRDHDGEAPEATARRELAEETGVVASSWRSLGRAFLAPGYSTELMHFFAATELQITEAVPAADERLDAAWFTPEGVRGLISAEELDVKTMAGLALVGWELSVGS